MSISARTTPSRPQEPADAGPATRAAEVHVLTIKRNTVHGWFAGVCSCGWVAVGTREEVEKRAAVHDLEPEWVPV